MSPCWRFLAGLLGVGAVLVSGACPLEVPLTSELSFSCANDSQCAAGQICLEHMCVREGLDAMVIDRVAGDASAMDVVVEDVGTADVGMADVRMTDTRMTDTRITDAGMMDVRIADAGMTDAAMPDTAMPDTAMPDSTLPADWWDAAWGWRQKLVFDNSAQAEALSDFPVLVALDTDVVDFGQIKDQGEDLRFVDPDSGAALAHEIERWDEGGTCIIWVKVPRIEASSNQDFIWMYYGEPDAADAQDVDAVWSNGYVGVWHMDGDPSGTPEGIPDSSPSAKHGTAINMLADDLVEGHLGFALDFDGSDDVVGINGSHAIGDVLDIVGGPLTLEGWIYPTGGNGTVVAKRNDGSTQWQLQIEHVTAGADFNPSFVRSGISGGSDFWYTSASYSLGSWYHLAVTAGADGAAQAIYVNGVSVPITASGSGDLVPRHVPTPVSIGARWAGPPTPGFLLTGVIDETRVSATQRSDAWMAAQHLSMTRSFVSFDAAEPR